MRLTAANLVLACAFGVVAAPLAAQGQPTGRPHRIGVLHDAYFPSIPQVEGLKAGLKANGFEEDRDVTLDVRFTRGNAEATASAAVALAKVGVDLIVTVRDETTQAAKAATQAIPIVFIGVGDPVAAGIVAAVNRPGGNVTGVSSLGTQLVPKRLEALKTLIPTLRRVWAVYHADDRSDIAAARKAEEVAPLLKLEVLARAARTSDELVGTLRGLRPGDGLLVPIAATLNIRGLSLDLTLGSRVPAVFDQVVWVERGGLVSYGSDPYADGTQAARLVARILRGTRPQDLPVEGSNKVELAINLKTAKSLGLAVPAEILARADRVVE